MTTWHPSEDFVDAAAARIVKLGTLGVRLGAAAGLTDTERASMIADALASAAAKLPESLIGQGCSPAEALDVTQRVTQRATALALARFGGLQ